MRFSPALPPPGGRRAGSASTGIRSIRSYASASKIVRGTASAAEGWVACHRRSLRPQGASRVARGSIISHESSATLVQARASRPSSVQRNAARTAPPRSSSRTRRAAAPRRGGSRTTTVPCGSTCTRGGSVPAVSRSRRRLTVGGSTSATRGSASHSCRRPASGAFTGRMIQCRRAAGSRGVDVAPMKHDELLRRSALELAASIRAKQVSPVEVAKAVLARIDALNPRLNAFCLVAPDVALNAAHEAEIAVVKGEPLGLLHGVPFSIKDVIFTRGLRTTGGSRLFADAVPEEDAVAVARMRAAGAVVLGKTNTSELGHQALTDNPLFGPTRNPWNL